MFILRKLGAVLGLPASGDADVFADRLDALSIHENWTLKPRTLLFRNRAVRRAA